MSKGGKKRDLEGLTDYERRFVDEYLVDFDAKAALIRAGFKGSVAKQAAYKLRHRAHVDQAIETAMKAAKKRAELTVDGVISRYRKFAYAESAEIVPGVPLKASDMLHALDKLGAYLGIFREDGPPPVPVQVIIYGLNQELLAETPPIEGVARRIEGS